MQKKDFRALRPKPTAPAPRARRGKAIYLLAAVPALVVIVVVAWLVLGGDKDKREIKQLIYAGIEAIKAEDVEACLALLHESYKDSLNNTYDNLLERVGKEFEGIEDIQIKIRQLDIQVQSGVGTATFEMRFSAKVQDSVGRAVPVVGLTGDHNPLGGGAWDAVSLRCLKREGRWLIAEAVIHSAGPR